MRFHPTRGSMSLSQKDGGLPPDSVVQDDDEILADSERLVGTAPRPRARRDGADRARAVLAVLVTPELMGAPPSWPSGSTSAAHAPRRRPRRGRVRRRDFGCRTIEHFEAVGWMHRPQLGGALHLSRTTPRSPASGGAGVGVAHCPSSNMMIGGGGIAPVVGSARRRRARRARLRRLGRRPTRRRSGWRPATRCCSAGCAAVRRRRGAATPWRSRRAGGAGCLGRSGELGELVGRRGRRPGVLAARRASRSPARSATRSRRGCGADRRSPPHRRRGPGRRRATAPCHDQVDEMLDVAPPGGRAVPGRLTDAPSSLRGDRRDKNHPMPSWPRDARRGARPRSPRALRRMCSPAAPTSWSRSTSATAARRWSWRCARRRARRAGASRATTVAIGAGLHLTQLDGAASSLVARCPRWPRPRARSAHRRSATPAPSAATSARARPPATRCPCSPRSTPRSSVGVGDRRARAVDATTSWSARSAPRSRRASSSSGRACPLVDGPQEFLKVGMRNAMVISVAASRWSSTAGAPCARARRRSGPRSCAPATPRQWVAGASTGRRRAADPASPRVRPPRRRPRPARSTTTAHRRLPPPRRRSVAAPARACAGVAADDERATTRCRSTAIDHEVARRVGRREPALRAARAARACPAPRARASRASAARARCSSTASSCARASCSRPRPSGARSPPSRACAGDGDAHRRAAGVHRRGRGAVRVLHARLSSSPCTTCSTAAPTRPTLEMREALSGNLCRCTGYGRIFAAVRRPRRTARRAPMTDAVDSPTATGAPRGRCIGDEPDPARRRAQGAGRVRVLLRPRGPTACSGAQRCARRIPYARIVAHRPVAGVEDPRRRGHHHRRRRARAADLRPHPAGPAGVRRRRRALRRRARRRRRRRPSRDVPPGAATRSSSTTRCSSR